MPPMPKTNLSQLDENLDFVSSKDSGITAPWCAFGLEDARLFHHAGGLYMVATGLVIGENGIEGSLAVAKLNDDLQSEWANVVVHPHANSFEKNWQFFSHAGRLFMVYSYYPHRVHACEIRDGQILVGGSFVSPVDWPETLPPNIRGGAPPVLVGNQWYHFFHCTDPAHDRWTYSCGLYTFEDRPPFAVTGFVPQVLLWPAKTNDYKDVVFPTGAVLQDGKWLLTFGYNDKETLMAVIAQSEIERLIIKTPEKKTLKEWGCVGDLKTIEPPKEVQKINTSFGEIYTNDPQTDASMAQEVMKTDCYRLKALSKIFTPKTVWDLGFAAGQVSMFCRQLWPNCKLLGVEADSVRWQAGKMNFPQDDVLNAFAGHDFRAGPAFDKYGFPDLLCIDCEGGEVPFFCQIEERNIAQHLNIVVGEWHMWAGRRCLEQALRETHVAIFSDPPAGAGPWHYFYAIPRQPRPNIPSYEKLLEWCLGQM